MFIPVGDEKQEILQIDKDKDGKVTTKSLMDVMVRQTARGWTEAMLTGNVFHGQYVPLTDKKPYVRILHPV